MKKKPKEPKITVLLKHWNRAQRLADKICESDDPKHSAKKLKLYMEGLGDGLHDAGRNRHDYQ